VHEGTVDSVYQQVGKVLADGKAGELVSHDDATHSYVVSVTAAAAKKRGFFSRLFGRHRNDAAGTAGGGTHQVQVNVESRGDAGSEIRAQSDSLGAVAKVIDRLKSKLD
jgi:hypothetical protein